MTAAPPPPPTPDPAPPWSLRAVDADADVDRVHEWMHRPHVAQRWQQAWSLARWRDCLAEQIAGEASRPFIVVRDGEPVAYLEIYRVCHHALAAHYPLHPHDLGLHLAVGDPGHVGRGRGSELLRLLGAALLALEPDCRRVVLEPEVSNVAMHRALAKAGYRAVGPVDLGHKTATLTVLERPGVPAVAPDDVVRERRPV